MKNLAKVQSSNISQDSENLYLYFNLGESKYALNIKHVMEIMKLPLLDYPQKLANNIVGLLNYNNFTINILDLRFYLGLKVTPYSILNQLLIVKTDESIFGLIIDKVTDIISLEQANIDYLPQTNDEKIIDFIYKEENATISIINLNAVENIIKHGASSLLDIDIPSLFPHDDDSRYKLVQRNQALTQKFTQNLVTNIFSQDKFISFLLGDGTYCINLEYVKEFLKNHSITPIPCNLDYVAGIIALRGEFISVIDIKKFLGFENISDDDYEGKNNIIILDFFDYKIGILVDKIFNIVEIPEELINENSHDSGKYILSEVMLEDKFYTILKMRDFFSDERLFIDESLS